MVEYLISGYISYVFEDGFSVNQLFVSGEGLMYDDFFILFGYIDFIVDIVDFILVFIRKIIFKILFVSFLMDIVIELKMVIVMVLYGGIGKRWFVLVSFKIY